MSIFGMSRPFWDVDDDDEVLDEAIITRQHGHVLSEQEDDDIAPPAHEVAEDDFSPPPPDLPTWDTVPFSNLPDVLGPSFASGYELRPGPRIEAKHVLSTWLDQDATATYQPDCERDPYLHPPAEIIEVIKRRRPIRPYNDQTRPMVPRTANWQQGRLEGKRLPVTISFKSLEGRAALAAFGSSLDNWPKSAWRLPNEQIDWESWWDAVPILDNDDSQDSSSGRRERPKVTSHTHELGGDTEHRALEELTLGHPEARGCKGCFELGQRCPLLDEGSRYPCDICVEDGCDCELVLQPAKKRGCLNCGHKRISCSYRQAHTDHSSPCSNCAARGLKCIAGPASGRTRTGPALDSVLTGKVHTVQKAFLRSRQNGRSKRRRALNQEPTTANRKKLSKPDRDDMFNATSRTRSRSICANAIVTEFEEYRTFNPNLAKADTHFIRTQLAHPIILNCNDDAPCHWCQDLGYGILGLGPAREVEVLDMNDGAGYVEVGGGYYGAGMDPSRMCTKCAVDRLEIAACLDHHIEDLRPIEGASHEPWDPNLVMDYMMPGMAATAPFMWCSVCPHPALYTCCKPSNEEVQALLGSQDSYLGCGLNLCKDCAEVLVHDVGGNLDSLVREKRHGDDHDVTLRADVDLILRDGEVVRRMGWIFTGGADLLKPAAPTLSI